MSIASTTRGNSCGDDVAIGARDLDELLVGDERRLHVRAHHRDLGFGDLRRGAPERAHELQDRLLADELAPDAQQVEQRDIGLAEAPLERPRVGEPGGPPHAQRERRADARALGDLRERRPRRPPAG